jgi:electron transport complex protein RnfC
MISELLDFVGLVEAPSRLILGGPMMGTPLLHSQIPIVKGASGILAFNAKEAVVPEEGPCIRCGKCAEACPIELQPMDLYWFARSKRFDKSEEWELFDCIECGACAYVCPSNIRLVDYFRFSKSEIWAEERQTRAADHARQRHEFRQFREEREKREKAERLAAKAAEKQQAAASSADPADAERAAKIKAAMERAAAKQAETTVETAVQTAAPVVESPAAIDPEKAERIRIAMEKRAAEKAALEAMSPEEKAAKDAEKQAKIAAALERASEHPLAEAIVEGAKTRGLSLGSGEEFEAITGKGVIGKVPTGK